MICIGAVVGAVWAIFAVRGSQSERGIQPAKRPNVVLISFCTLRADRLGCYGYPQARTTYLDALAGDGVTFDAHYTQASFSGGSFASILTGRYCCGHTVFDHPMFLPDENVTMAEMLGEAGYRTAAFVEHPIMAPKFNYQQGFEIYNSTGPAEELVRQAAAWIRQHSTERFFLWYQAKPTHFPFEFPPQLIRPVEGGIDPAIWRSPSAGLGSPPARGRLMFDFESLNYTPRQFASAMAAYDASVSFCDELAGGIISQLADSGLTESTAIIVVSDHGDEHGEHGFYFNHDANLYEPTVRVPLIISLPGGRHAGGRVRPVTRNIDLLPTVAELAGVAPPPGVDGLSLLPVLAGEGDPRDAFAESRPFHESRAGLANYRQYIPGIPGKWRMIRRGDYKLICIPAEADGAAAYELYDLARDPAETNNLAGQLPEVCRDLAQSLDQWFAGYEGTNTTPRRLDEADLDALRSLGYIE